MLHALGLPLPKAIFAHGWWLSGDTKMSKSLGNVVNPMDMADKYGVDPFRYYLMAEMVLGQDANFTEESFQRRFNADLANDIGNLLSRLLKMTRDYCGGQVPRPADNALAGEPEKELWAAVQAAVAGMERSLAEMRIEAGLAGVQAAVRAANRYLEVKQPWLLAKQDDQLPLHTTLYMTLEVLRVVAGLLSPIMPGKMQTISKAIGMPDGHKVEFPSFRQWGVLVPGHHVHDTGPLFPRIITAESKETPAGKVPQAKPGKKAAAENVAVGTVEEIAYDDFAKIQLRTAKILAAEKVAGADKLLQLRVQVGEEERQLVAGIALHYQPEQLIGKTIIIVANLKPAKIRGVESRGMLLAASVGDQLRLVTVDGEIASGARVK